MVDPKIGPQNPVPAKPATPEKPNVPVPGTTRLDALTDIVSRLAQATIDTNTRLDALVKLGVKTPAVKKTKAKPTDAEKKVKEERQTAREIEYARLKVENEKAGRGMLNARYYCSETSCKFHTYNGPGSMKNGFENNPWVKHIAKNPAHVMMTV